MKCRCIERELPVNLIQVTGMREQVTGSRRWITGKATSNETFIPGSLIPVLLRRSGWQVLFPFVQLCRRVYEVPAAQERTPVRRLRAFCSGHRQRPMGALVIEFQMQHRA